MSKVIIFFLNKQNKANDSNEGISTYQFVGARYFIDLTENTSVDWMYTMRHTYRGSFQIDQWKCIHNTATVFNLVHHRNIGCVGSGQCKTLRVDVTDGYFLHHRIGWKVIDQTLSLEHFENVTINDPIILKYKTRLEIAMKNILIKIFK